MKKFLFLLVMALAIFALTGCPDGTGATDPPIEEPEEPIEPPIIEVPPTFEDVVIGKFWQVEGIERYQDTRPPARGAESLPYEKEICMLWGIDTITAYDDLNDDGFMSPGEEIATVDYVLAGDVITIDGLEFMLTSFDANGWSMTTYLDGTTNPDWLGDENDDWQGYVVVHYIPCTFPWLDEEISFNFAFVFDDMGDTNAEWDRTWKIVWKCWWPTLEVEYTLDINFDDADAFYFTSGTPADSYIDDDPILGNHIFIVDFHDPFTFLGGPDDIDTVIVIDTEQYGPQAFEGYEELKPEHVYDMYVVVTAADNATFQFISRIDGSGFTRDATLDFSEMGELQIRGVDDADVPVVNPTL